MATANSRHLVSDLMRDVSHLSKDGQARVARVREVLDACWRNRLRGTLRDRVEGAWLALGGPACVAEATELEDAEIFFDALEGLERAGGVDLGELAEALDELYALPDLDAGKDAVEIMTIHKAKGLEFDTVIVPGLDRVPRSGFKKLFEWKSFPDSRLLLAPINETGTDDEPAYNYIRALEREAEDIEAGRLFYVAATRAKQRLHLLAMAKPDEEGRARPPARRSLLEKIWWQAREHFGPAPAQALAPAAPEPLHDVLRRLPAGFALPPLPREAAWEVPKDELAEEAQVEFSWAGETARHVGTVVHRWLQRMAEDGLAGWDAARVDSLEAAIGQDLARRGVTAGEVGPASALVAAALRNALSDERGRWVLGPHPEARAEYRIRHFSDGQYRTYVMDRVFRDEGQLWIVDYKTSRHEGAGVEGFLDREQERYAAQLSAYRNIFEDARTALYFPLLKGWRQWNR